MKLRYYGRNKRRRTSCNDLGSGNKVPPIGRFGPQFDKRIDSELITELSPVDIKVDESSIEVRDRRQSEETGKLRDLRSGGFAPAQISVGELGHHGPGAENRPGPGRGGPAHRPISSPVTNLNPISTILTQ